MSSASNRTATILGVDVSAINMVQAVDTISRWISEGEQHYVCVTGVHGLIESHKDERLKRIHNQAGLVTPDGMPLVWLGRMKGFKEIERVYGPDLMLAICQDRTGRQSRHFFYGGDQGVAETLASRLIERFPGLNVAGFWSPPFRQLTSEEDEEVVKGINATKPDIVWVGLSTPKQEYWMHRHLTRIDAPVMIGVGAAFDFNADVKKQAPRWMQKNGLEWLFRVLSEPRRLWRRYLTIIPLFGWLILLEALGVQQPKSAIK